MLELELRTTGLEPTKIVRANSVNVEQRHVSSKTAQVIFCVLRKTQKTCDCV